MSSNSRSRSRSPVDNKGFNVSKKQSKLTSKRVVIINLPYDCKWQEVKDTFKQKLGFVGYLELLESNGRPAGMGVMEFKSFDGASEAIEKMTGVDVCGRKIIVRSETERDRAKFDRMRMSSASRTIPTMPNVSIAVPHVNSPTDVLTPALLGQLGIEGPVNNTIFVSNLAYNITWHKIKDVFKLAGKVVNVDLKEDSSGKSKGIALVKFETPFEAVQAISMFNNQMLFDRPMHIRMDRQVPVAPGFVGGGHLPSGLSGVGMGLGPGGAPARDPSEVSIPRQSHVAGRSEFSNGRSANSGGDTVVVKNLPFSFTWQDLKRSFRKAGEVRFTEIQKNAQNKSSGVGIVRFSSVVDARNAVSIMNGEKFDGRSIRVELA